VDKSLSYNELALLVRCTEFCLIWACCSYNSNKPKDVKKLPKDQQKMEILTPDEVRRLFTKKWETVWKNYYFFMTNKLSVFTDMWIGEVAGLRGEFVFEKYVRVCEQ
jgi:hypothetical protein